MEYSVLNLYLLSPPDSVYSSPVVLLLLLIADCHQEIGVRKLRLDI